MMQQNDNYGTGLFQGRGAQKLDTGTHSLALYHPITLHPQLHVIHLSIRRLLGDSATINMQRQNKQRPYNKMNLFGARTVQSLE